MKEMLAGCNGITSRGDTMLGKDRYLGVRA
jgi:hypothetical protein